MNKLKQVLKAINSVIIVTIGQLRGGKVLERLIPAGLEHIEVIWGWRNDETTRHMSLSSDYVPWGQHQDWYSRAVTDLSKKMFIYELDGVAVAVIRFDIIGDSAEISINVASALRGKGIGTRAIREAIKMFKGISSSNIRTITATIKKVNEASLKTFFKNEFIIERETEDIVTLKHVLS